MRILGIDYGKVKIGVSLATSMLAEPLGVIRYKIPSEVFTKLEKIVEKESIEEVVIGISEGGMEEETREFARLLKAKLSLPVHFQDETLTTKDAQIRSIEANIKRKKRKELEDAYAATVMLQSYLDQRRV